MEEQTAGCKADGKPQKGLSKRQFAQLVALKMEVFDDSTALLRNPDDEALFPELWERATEPQRHRADTWAMHGIDLYSMNHGELDLLAYDINCVLRDLESAGQ